MKKGLKFVALTAVAVLLCVCLIACIPNDYNKAIENLDAADYNVLSYKKGDIGFELAVAAYSLIGAKNITALVTAYNGDEDGIFMLYFEDSDSAKACFDKIKENLENDKDLKEMDDIKIKRSGNCIYAGTSAAIKAAR